MNENSIDRDEPLREPLGVIVVTYNSVDHLADLIRSLPAAAGPLDLEVVVVDNASSDDTVALARSFPQVHVIPTGDNLGYSGAINVGRRHLGPGRTVAILNPDLTLSPHALWRLVTRLQEPSVGMVSPRLYDSNGSLFPHLRKETSLLGSLGDALLGGRWTKRPRWLSDVYLRRSDYECERDVGWAGGAALLIRGDCDTAVGDWDSERYFLYSEETDYARRARDQGYRVVYVPDAEAIHHGGASGTSDDLLALMSVNRVRYVEETGGRARSLAFRGVVATNHLLRLHRSAHRHAFRVVTRRELWDRLPKGPPIPDESSERVSA